MLLTKNRSKLLYRFHDIYEKIVIIIDRAIGNIL